MTWQELGFKFSSSQLAIAISHPSRSDFTAMNSVFSSSFSDIHGPEELHALVASQKKSKSTKKSKTIIKFNNLFWELLEFNLDGEFICHLLKNISHEMEILQKLKEKLKEMTDTSNLYAGILSGGLPIGIMITDKDYNVSFVNTTLKRFFHIPSKATLSKCYNYVKEIKPCDECILMALQAGERKNKKTFNTGDCFVTAEIHRLDDKFVFAFRDTTKEINLIQEIKKQQENLEKANKMIAEQNDILKRLSNINVRISQLKHLDEVLGIAVNSIIETFESHKGALLLFNNSGQIKNAHFTGTVKEEERDSIIKSIGSGITGKYLEEKFPEYTITDMLNESQTNGKLFLFKPGKTVDPSILELFLMQINNYLENLKLQRKLEEIAQTDSLTGVFNRYYFDKKFVTGQELSMRFGQPLSLIVVDVNGLKEANDSIGHEAGDALLKKTADMLQENISDYDSIYRIGGDEFIVMLSNCPENQLNVMVEMYREMQTVANIQFKEDRLPIRFSLGGACSTEVPHYKLKETADKRMYEDKAKFYETRKKYR